MSNLTSRTITGGIMTMLGLILIIVPFIYFGFETLFAWIYGVPLLIIGLFILFNQKEDKIERIKHGRKK
jgi:membrane-bound ClpP family serine protease